MTASRDSGSSRAHGEDPSLDRILREYFELRERGEEVDQAAFVTRHPRFAEELERFFRSERCLESRAPFGALAALPQRIPGFELLEEIARGGMGVVFRARQLKPERVVALKILHSGRGPWSDAAEETRRFRIEIEAAAALDHPGIVPIYAVGETHGVPWYAMKLVEGADLSVHLGRKPAPRVAAQIVARVADAVHHAHLRGILHRDLKPQNIILSRDGDPHVSDFGLAKVAHREQTELTRSGDILGTPRYMAPEQALGGARSASVQSDVYSLGMVLYALLTSRPAFDAATPVETLRQVIDIDPIRPGRRSSRVPRELDAVCMKCLEKDPSKRYASSAELAADLRRFLEGKPVKARSYGWVTLAIKSLRRRPWLAAALLVLAIGVVGLVAGSVIYARREHRHVAELAARDAIHRHYRFAARLSEAYSEWKDGNWPRAREQLADVAALQEDGSLGFAWHHLDALLHPPPGEVRCTGLPAEEALVSVLTRDAEHLVRIESDHRLTVWDLRGPQAREVSHSLDEGYFHVVAATGSPRVAVRSLRGVEVLRLGNEPSASFHPAILPSWDRRGLAISGNGDVVAMDAGDHIRCYDVEEGSLQEIPFPWSQGAVRGLALDADGRRCAVRVWGNDQVCLYFREEGRYLWRRAAGESGFLFFAPDGQRMLALRAPGRHLGVYDSRDGNLLGPLVSGHVFRSISMQPRSPLVLAASRSVLSAWDVDTLEPVLTSPLDGVEAAVAAGLVEGTHAAVVTSRGELLTWPIDALAEPVRERGGAETIWLASISPDRRELITADEGYAVKLWSLVEEGQGQRRIDLRAEKDFAGHRCGAFAPDGRLVAGGRDDGSVTLYSGTCAEGGEPFEPLATWKTSGAVLDLAFSERGGMLAVLSRGRWTLLDLSPEEGLLQPTLRFSLEIDTGGRRVLWLQRFSPDGRLLALQGPAPQLRIVDLERRRFCASLRFAREAFAIVFSPDARRLVVGSSDRKTRIWKLCRGAEDIMALDPDWELSYQNSGIWCLAFSPDGETLATGSDDGTIVLWDLVDEPMGAIGLIQAVLDGHAGGVKQLAFTPDGRALLSAGGSEVAGGEICVWRGERGR